MNRPAVAHPLITFHTVMLFTALIFGFVVATGMVVTPSTEIIPEVHAQTEAAADDCDDEAEFTHACSGEGPATPAGCQQASSACVQCNAKLVVEQQCYDYCIKTLSIGTVKDEYCIGGGTPTTNGDCTAKLDPNAAACTASQSATINCKCEEYTDWWGGDPPVRPGSTTITTATTN